MHYLHIKEQKIASYLKLKELTIYYKAPHIEPEFGKKRISKIGPGS